MSRCLSCDRIPVRALGTFTLQDGTKVEETLCGNCKAAAFEEYCITDKVYAHGNFDIFQLSHPHGVTPAASIED